VGSVPSGEGRCVEGAGGWGRWGVVCSGGRRGGRRGVGKMVQPFRVARSFAARQCAKKTAMPTVSPNRLGVLRLM